MKQLAKFSRMVTQIEDIFRELNSFKFHDALVLPVITISTVARTETLSAEPKWDVRGESQHQMTIPLLKLEGTQAQAVMTILHLLVHLSNMQGPICKEVIEGTGDTIFIQYAPIQDCSRGGTYHNKHFYIVAERRGLLVQKTDKGFQPVGITEDVHIFIEQMGWRDFAMSKYQANYAV